MANTDAGTIIPAQHTHTYYLVSVAGTATDEELGANYHVYFVGDMAASTALAWNEVDSGGEGEFVYPSVGQCFPLGVPPSA